MIDVRDQMKQYDRDFAVDKDRAQFKPGPEVLPDGDHTLQVLYAETDLVGKDADKKQPVLRVGLRATEGKAKGLSLESVYWLNDQQNINRLGTDLFVLGFEKPPTMAFSDFLYEVMSKLVGIHLRAHKKTNEGKGPNQGKQYHNLYVNARVAGSAAPMPTFQQPALVGVSQTDDEVPF